MLILLIVFSILGLLALALAALVSMFAPMAFDAPGSNNDPRVWLLVLGVVFAPFIMLACLVAAWLLYWRKFRRIAVFLAAVLTIAVLLISGVLMASAV
jgi:hypothetical protein